MVRLSDQFADGDWFTVQRAAELLEVSVSRIYDRIRDGRLKVHHPGKDAPGERPLVTSQDLIDRGGGGQPDQKEAKQNLDEASSRSGDLPLEEDVGKKSSHKGGRDSKRKDSSAKNGARGRSSSLSQQEAAFLKTDPAAPMPRAALQLGSEEENPRELLLLERHRRAQLEIALDAERRSLAQLRQSMTKGKDKAGTVAKPTTGKPTEDNTPFAEPIEAARRMNLAEIADLREDLERKSGELHQIQVTRRELEIKLATLEKDASATAEDLQRAQKSLDQADDRLDESLKAIYDRDVRIARLESQVEAASTIREAGKGFSDQLQDRVVRLEDSSDEKEKEIRRLALALGEARGEIRLLKAPDDAPQKLSWWKRSLPFTVSVLYASGVFALSYQLAVGEQPFASASVAAGALLTAVVYARQRRQTSPRG